MRYCQNCHVNVSTDTDICPLCHQALPKSADDKVEQTYPKFKKYVNLRHRAAKIISSVAPFAIAVCVLINLLTWNGHLWSAIVAAAGLYAWLLGLFTFKRSILLGVKLMAHAIAIALLLVAINVFSSDVETVTTASWALAYAMPSVFIGFILAINILMLTHRQKLRDFLVSQFSLCVIGFVPLILVFIGLVHPIYMSIAAAGFSGATIIGLFIFAKRIVVSVLTRKLHL